MRSHAELVAAQLALQRANGYNFITMTDAERLDYIRWNVLAVEDELHEALGETGWKPWATSKHINEDAFFGELRDAWQFLTNLMLVCYPKLTPEELTQRFDDTLSAKHQVNFSRIAESYDGVSTKCSQCRRALDDFPGGHDCTTGRVHADVECADVSCEP